MGRKCLPCHGYFPIEFEPGRGDFRPKLVLEEPKAGWQEYRTLSQALFIFCLPPFNKTSVCMCQGPSVR